MVSWFNSWLPVSVAAWLFVGAVVRLRGRDCDGAPGRAIAAVGSVRQLLLRNDSINFWKRKKFTNVFRGQFHLWRHKNLTSKIKNCKFLQNRKTFKIGLLCISTSFHVLRTPKSCPNTCSAFSDIYSFSGTKKWGWKNSVIKTVFLQITSISDKFI